MLFVKNSADESWTRINAGLLIVRSLINPPENDVQINMYGLI